MSSNQNNGKKTQKISIRCSTEERELIVKEAKKANKSISDYLLDTHVPGRVSKKELKAREREKITKIITVQQAINTMDRYLTENPNGCDHEFRKLFESLKKKGNLLWEF